jgi:hypothetical protein
MQFGEITIALVMEAICTSETSVYFNETTGHWLLLRGDIVQSVPYEYTDAVSWSIILLIPVVIISDASNRVLCSRCSTDT